MSLTWIIADRRQPPQSGWFLVYRGWWKLDRGTLVHPLTEDPSVPRGTDYMYYDAERNLWYTKSSFETDGKVYAWLEGLEPPADLWHLQSA